MTIGERIKRERERKGLTQVELAECINVTKQSLYKYENNIISNIPSDKIEAIAECLNISPALLMGWEQDENDSKSVKIPVLGCVAAGIPLNAVEHIIDYEEISDEMARKGEFFGLKIKGNSMEPRILEGDVVIVQKQSTVNSGDVAIVLVNGDSATCKKISIQNDGIFLISYNPSFEPRFYSKKEVQTLPVEIIGKVVELRGKF